MRANNLTENLRQVETIDSCIYWMKEIQPTVY